MSFKFNPAEKLSAMVNPKTKMNYILKKLARFMRWIEHTAFV